MAFDKNALIERFKKWCYQCLDVIRTLPLNYENKVFTNQAIRSCTSSYMNYKAACRAKSIADMINKLKIVEEELDESIGWLEMMRDRNEGIKTDWERSEGNELLSIVVASIRTLRTKNQN
ncbi:MAG: four helix bundle protein [Bacteroidota bacterium]